MNLELLIIIIQARQPVTSSNTNINTLEHENSNKCYNIKFDCSDGGMYGHGKSLCSVSATNLNVCFVKMSSENRIAHNNVMLTISR